MYESSRVGRGLILLRYLIGINGINGDWQKRIPKAAQHKARPTLTHWCLYPLSRYVQGDFNRCLSSVTTQGVIRQGPHLAARRRDTRQFAPGGIGIIGRVAVVIRHNIFTRSD